MTLVRFQPAPLPRLFSDFLNPVTAQPVSQPVVNVLETNSGFRLEIAAPGLSKEDFQLKIEKNLLHISAQKNPETGEGVKTLRREFAYGSFERVFRLPETIDQENVGAEYSNGILVVRLEKKAESQPVVKTIAIN